MLSPCLRFLALCLISTSAVCILPSTQVLAQEARIRDELSYPLAVRLSLVNNVVMPGEPLILRWRVWSTVSQDIDVTPAYEGESWLNMSLQGPDGYSVPVTDVSFIPDHLINKGGRQISAERGPSSNKDREVVLRSEWKGKPAPGDYTLKILVCLPYGVGTGSDTLYKQTFSLPIKVVAANPAALQKAAEAARKDVENGSAENKELSNAKLFGFSEPYTILTWRQFLVPSHAPRAGLWEFFDQITNRAK